MTDPILRKLAQTVVHYSLDTRPGDVFVVRTSTLGVPLLQEVYREALTCGAHVSCHLSFDRQSEIYYEAAQDDQLDWLSPIDRLEAETVTARLSINAPFNTRESAGIDPARMARRIRAQGDLGKITRVRSAAGALRWCSTLYPTNALAQEACMSLGQYRDFVFDAMFLDRDDPIAAWRAFSADQQRRVDRLNTVQTLRIVAEDTDLTLSVADRQWMNSDGKRNFPSGEVFTGPVEDTARGHILFTFPAIAGGRDVEGVRLWFESGQVVRAEAARGAEYLQEMLGTDNGARFLGEVAIGNNYNIQRFSRNTLFDEKIGGTCHLALGASYPDTGGRNESAVHWDMVCDLRRGGGIYVDGELIHKDGQWVT